MEDYKSITNYLKLDKYFIDENSKINFLNLKALNQKKKKY